MTEKRFICMFVLSVFAGLIAQAAPASAIGSALVVVVLGFDGVCLAIATEARRAETPQSGSVHEGAGRQASPNLYPPSGGSSHA